MRRALLLAGALLLACGDDGGTPVGDGAARCGEPADCDDGLFCNGVESCAPEDPAADARGCVAAEAPCAGACDEEADRCARGCETPDADGDGVDARECGGEDCDDGDATVHPGASERCDAIDQDCDPETLGDRDEDGDGFVDAACCSGERCGEDCDDGRADVHPGEGESCDGVDQDCDGEVDEGALATFVVDADGDGHGSAAAGAERVEACAPPAGYVPSADDCDDGAGSVHPGAYDRCDGEVDDDCSGEVDDPPGGCACEDGETRTCPFPGACAASRQLCVAGIWAGCGLMAQEEICGNEVDEDCDGAVDDGCDCGGDVRVCGSDVGTCERGVQRCTTAGWGPCEGEVPAEPETCNDADDDCDGEVDEGLRVTCWADGDGDGFAWATARAVERCGASCPMGTTDRDPGVEPDCDDDDGAAFPGQTRYFPFPHGGSFDWNCDGEIEADVPETQACELAAGGGSCTVDTWFEGGPGRCGEEVREYACYVDDRSGECVTVETCDPLGGGMSCRRVACR